MHMVCASHGYILRAHLTNTHCFIMLGIHLHMEVNMYKLHVLGLIVMCFQFYSIPLCLVKEFW